MTASFITSVHSSGRYLLDQFGQPFLVNADTPWGLIGGYPGSSTNALNATGWSTYLLDRQSNGFNTILFDVGSGPDASGNQPFTSFPSLTSAYWANVDTLLQMCASCGISPYLGVADAYYLETVSGLGTAAQFTTYAQSLATRWANTTTYPGIVWFFGNDYAGDGVGSGNGSNYDSRYEGFITGLTNEGDTRPITIELGYNESLCTDSSTWASRVTINSVYTYNVNYEAALRAYAYSTKILPAVHIESAYENSSEGHPDTPLDLRKIVCWSLTSGCVGHFYGNDNLWEFNTGWQSDLDTTEVAQNKALNTVFQGIDWWKLVPDTSSRLVTSGRGSQYTTVTTSIDAATNDATYGHWVSAAYAADGSLAVIYNPDTSTNTSMTISSAVLGSSPTITAVDPTNGATSSLGWTTTPTKGANAGGDHDWLFIITAGTAAFVAPAPYVKSQAVAASFAR